MRKGRGHARCCQCTSIRTCVLCFLSPEERGRQIASRFLNWLSSIERR
jgi:hypothetical protein